MTEDKEYNPKDFPIALSFNSKYMFVSGEGNLVSKL